MSLILPNNNSPNNRMTLSSQRKVLLAIVTLLLTCIWSLLSQGQITKDFVKEMKSSYNSFYDSPSLLNMNDDIDDDDFDDHLNDGDDDDGNDDTSNDDVDNSHQDNESANSSSTTEPSSVPSAKPTRKVLPLEPTDGKIEQEEETKKKQQDESKDVEPKQENQSDTTNNNPDDNNENSINNDEPPNPHPHAGAKDPNNQWGYVPDITLLRQQHIQTYGLTKEFPIIAINNTELFTYACNTTLRKGWEGNEGFDLMQKIQIDTKQMLLPTKSSNDNVVEAESQGEKEASRPKLLCGIYTYDKNHPRIEAVVNAWGWKCDGFFAASTLTDPSIGAINLPHYGEEAYNNMWQKTRSIWAYIYDNYMNDYDYFWLGGDDFYLIVENLLKFLGTTDSSNGEARLIGHQIPSGGSNFCGGGSGYVLNRMAVKRFVEEALPTCANTTIISAEDRFLSMCMRNIGIRCEHGIDDNGRKIFNGMDPQFLATFRGDRGYFKKVYEYWGKISGTFRWGEDLVSEDSTGFHNLRYPAFLLRIYAIFHPDACPNDSVLVKDFESYQRKERDV